MKIKYINISNFKSLTKEQNKLILDDTMTILLGVNESGKSNIIDAIGNINLLGFAPKLYQKSINVSCENGEVVEISFCFEDSNKNETSITYKTGYYPKIKGALIEKFNNNILIKQFKSQLEIIDTTGFPETIKKSIQILKDNEILYPDYVELFSSVFRIISGKYSLPYSLEDILKEIENIYDELPKIIYIPLNFTELKGTYTYKEILETKNDSFIQKFLFLCGISKEDIKNLSALDGSKFETKRRILINRIKSNIVEPFEKYYNHKDFKIEMVLTENSLNLFGVTDEKYVSLDFRSQGLKWYFMFFVYMQSLSITLDSNFLFLFDEPGIYLHINAQKELLRFLRELCKNNSQVIFSTHLPFMIETDNLNNLRAIIKDEKGNTQIHNNIFSSKIPVYGKNNTLAPIFNSIGFNLNHSIFGDGVLNVLVEGITDKIILDAMNKKYYNKSVNFIPCGGASNIKNVLSLVLGFGYDFIIFFDADKVGIREAKQIYNSYSFAVQDKLFLINGLSFTNDAINSSNYTIESNISTYDLNKLETIYDGTDETKKNFALEFYKKVINNQLELNNETIDNFDRIFNLL